MSEKLMRLGEPFLEKLSEFDDYISELKEDFRNGCDYGCDIKAIVLQDAEIQRLAKENTKLRAKSKDPERCDVCDGRPRWMGRMVPPPPAMTSWVCRLCWDQLRKEKREAEARLKTLEAEVTRLEGELAEERNTLERRTEERDATADVLDVSIAQRGKLTQENAGLREKVDIQRARKDDWFGEAEAQTIRAEKAEVERDEIRAAHKETAENCLEIQRRAEKAESALSSERKAHAETARVAGELTDAARRFTIQHRVIHPKQQNVWDYGECGVGCDLCKAIDRARKNGPIWEEMDK